MSDNVIEIRITGAVDSSLSASVSQAKTITGTLADQAGVAVSGMSGALKAVAGGCRQPGFRVARSRQRSRSDRRSGYFRIDHDMER